MTGLSFLHPVLLLVLLTLPLIYLLLKVIPPAAKRVVLPTTRFLHDLDQKNPPVQKIPWWLLLLRLAIPAFLIIGLAGPVLNPQKNLSGTGPILLIMDNGWSATQTWADQQQAALSVLQQAKRANRPVSILLTSLPAGEDRLPRFPAMSPDAAISQLKGLTPASWPGRPDLVAKTLTEDEKGHSASWISSGLAEPGYRDLLTAVPSLAVHIPPRQRLPMVLRPPLEKNGEMMARVEAVTGVPSTRVQISTSDRRARMTDQVSVNVTGGHGYVDVPYGNATQNKDDIALTRLENRTGPGAVLLSDRSLGNTRIGLVGASEGKESYSLTDPAYYISRAVQPFATLTTGTVDSLTADNPGMIILADNNALPPKTLETLSTWVRKGGILLRFANSALAESADTLTPVPLRKSERSLQGSMTWDNPLSVKSINLQSPLAGLQIPANINVRRQLLAEPTPDLAEKSWVTLSDDTPLVTAAQMDKGLLVLVHTTATPEWSDLPLSGFYVDLMRTTLNLAGKSDKLSGTIQQLRPLQILDAFGQLVPPPTQLKPVSRDAFSTLGPSHLAPPGYYGNEDESYALNLGDRLPPLEPLSLHVPAGQLHDGSEGSSEINLAKPFLYICAILLALDCLITLLLSGLIMRLRWGFGILLVFVILQAAPAHAAADDAAMAGEIHLAYIMTGDQVIDTASAQGLAILTQNLNMRTAVKAGTVVGLTPGQDKLSFYPLIYWPITTSQSSPDAKAVQALQDYIDHGGMLLIDSRDGRPRPKSLGQSAQMTHMQELLNGLSFNPLLEAPDKHVIFKSFYLLNIYDDLSLAGDVYLEDEAIDESGKVSSVLLTGNDWARIWGSQGSASMSSHEQSIRFGINVVMYALTGNYKSDQVHMTTILQRLGE